MSSELIDRLPVMATISAYSFLSLDGFSEGPGEDISWHDHGPEETQYSVDSLAGGATLVFGRTTYEHMAAFWPTPMAAEQVPEVARGMNDAAKIVCTRTPFTPDWQGTRCVSGDVVAEIRSLRAAGRDLTVLGSGSIVRLLTDHGLVDRYEIMIDPVAIGAGTSLFAGITRRLDLRLVDHRAFTSGKVLLTYEPADTATG